MSAVADDRRRCEFEWFVAALHRLSQILFGLLQPHNRWQDDETLIASLDEPIKTVVAALIEGHLLPDGPQIHQQGRLRNDHLQGNLAKFANKVNNLLVDLFVFVVSDCENSLNSLHQWVAKFVIEHFCANLPPITLILLAKNIWNAGVELIRFGRLPDTALHRQEMRLDLLDDLRQRVHIKIDHAVEVELTAENVKEDVLGVTFVELADRVH
jgi:hypothetical protein